MQMTLISLQFGSKMFASHKQQQYLKKKKRIDLTLAHFPDVLRGERLENTSV